MTLAPTARRRTRLLALVLGLLIAGVAASALLRDAGAVASADEYASRPAAPRAAGDASLETAVFALG